MSRFLTALLAVILAYGATVLPTPAATTGLVRGTITLDGRPAAGAAVILAGEGSRFSATADAKGAYVFPQVPFGTYRVVARAAGGHELATFVTVSSDTVATVNLALTSHLTQIAQTTVTAHAGLQANPTSVNQITRSTIEASPVQNSLDKLIATLPGVVPFSYNEPVINGFHGVTYNIDGAPLPLATTSNFAEIVDPKNIDSVELLTGAIPAEYGGDRMGGVVNIITNRPTDLAPGFYATLTGGAGNQAQRIGSLDTAARFGSSEIFFNANSQTTTRGLDAPTFDPIHDASSQSDQFVRFLTQLGPRSTLAFDYSNQLAQFQIPINTNPNNPYDPIFTPPNTDDVQREYDRFSNLNFTQTSRDGNGIFQIIPWWRSTRINYDGDVAADVLGLTENLGSEPTHNVGLLSNTYASYVGLRLSDFRATERHAWKFGLDVNRSNLLANQAFACYFPNCASSGVHEQPYYLVASPEQTQAGSQVGIYAQDKWQISNNVQLSYGLRYDHSTGYTSGWQISPRVGVSVWDGGKNTVHAYYGRFYAAPLLEDVRQDCVVLQGCPTTPVYDLQPERDAYYEIGLKHAFNSSFTGSLNLFRKTVVNILDTTQLLNTPLFAVFNNAIGLDSGLEMRLDSRLRNGDAWFLSATVSGSYAACVSGSTFLFPPGTNPNQSCVSQLSPEDHDATVVSTAGYTWRLGNDRSWFTTLQGNYASGFPVQFENAATTISGRLPAHTTLDIAVGRALTPGRGQDRGLGLSLIVTNVLNHQYPIKIANGFNTTQIANGVNALVRLTTPF
jgi:outer membrane receptor protein involved in Fe transport